MIGHQEIPLHVHLVLHWAIMSRQNSQKTHTDIPAHEQKHLANISCLDRVFNDPFFDCPYYVVSSLNKCQI